MKCYKSLSSHLHFHKNYIIVPSTLFPRTNNFGKHTLFSESFLIPIGSNSPLFFAYRLLGSMGACTKSKNISSKQVTITRMKQTAQNLNLPFFSSPLRRTSVRIQFTVTPSEHAIQLLFPCLTGMLTLNNLHKNWKRYVPSSRKLYHTRKNWNN